jgi:hypothetical protein
VRKFEQDSDPKPRVRGPRKVFKEAAGDFFNRLAHYRNRPGSPHVLLRSSLSTGIDEDISKRTPEH